MISSHAHWDVEGHAAMKRVTGARWLRSADAVALESGQDNSAIGARDFEPVTVDRVIEDGDTVTHGIVAALWTGGTGATMWMTTVRRWRHLLRRTAARNSEPGGSALQQSPTPDGRHDRT